MITEELRRAGRLRHGANRQVTEGGEWQVVEHVPDIRLTHVRFSRLH
jgi:hypothetical protein